MHRYKVDYELRYERKAGDGKAKQTQRRRVEVHLEPGQEFKAGKLSEQDAADPSRQKCREAMVEVITHSYKRLYSNVECDVKSVYDAETGKQVYPKQQPKG